MSAPTEPHNSYYPCHTIAIRHFVEIMISVLGDAEAISQMGSRIRETRLQRNLSQSHVASVVGISLPTYRKIEAGDGSIEFRHVARTLAVLGYADALADLIPPVAPEVSIKQLMESSGRKRASQPRKKA